MIKSAAFFLFFTVLLFAQPSVDSILSVSKNQPDTAKARVFANLCWDYRSISPSSAIEYGYTSLHILDSSPNDDLKADVFNYIGVIYSNLGYLDSAIQYYNRAYDLAIFNEDSSSIAYSLSNIGDYFFKNALYSPALEKIIASLKIFELLNDTKGLAYAYNDMGEVYLRLKDYPKALESFQQSLEYRQKNSDKRGIAKSLTNIALAQEMLGKYKESLEIFYRSIEVSKQANYRKGESYAYGGISDLYFKQGNYSEALNSAQQALEIDISIEHKYGEIINYNRLGKIYAKLMDFNRAEKYLINAIQQANLTGHQDQLMEGYRTLATVSVSKGNFQQAYTSLAAFDSLREKIYSQESLLKIGDMQTALAMEKKDKENEILRRDIEYQKVTTTLFIILALFVLGLGGLYVSKYRSEKRANQLLQELNNSKDKLFSIIAHDLKNPFTAVSIYTEILHSEYDEYSDEERKSLIESLYSASNEVMKLLMDLLTWARAQKGEITITKSDIDAEPFLRSLSSMYELTAKNKNINLSVDCSPGFKFSADRFICETVIRNFLNNAIKFSFNDSVIIIGAIKNEKNVEFWVQDFGKGMEKSVASRIFDLDSKFTSKGTNNERGTGFGLKISKEFADAHKGKLTVDSEPGKGSRFTFTIPL